LQKKVKTIVIKMIFFSQGSDKNEIYIYKRMNFFLGKKSFLITHILSYNVVITYAFFLLCTWCKKWYKLCWKFHIFTL